MALKTTRWTPDTCEGRRCVFDYSWDDSDPQDSRVHTFSNHVRLCTAHAGLTGSQGYDQCLTENQRKNNVVSLVNADIVGLVEGVDLLWGFDPSVVGGGRVLKIALPNVTNADVIRLQAAVDLSQGIGKVIVARSL